jgi:inorganic pyrophosphatase
MDIHSIVLHPEFPQKVCVIVEQPHNEPHRWSYDPETGTFSRLPNKSLFYDRGFTSGVYGWIGGSGIPPGPHHDVILLTEQFPSCGDVLLGHICGVFLRQDNDHKFVAVDDDIRQGMETADLAFLDKAYYRELMQLYPRIDEGEGWYGAEVAFSYLYRKPLSN